MRTVLLENDGRCRWLEQRVLRTLMPRVARAAVRRGEKTMYVIEDWMSSDGGRIGVDRTWLAASGLPVVKSVVDLPPGNDFVVVNTGYDSIVHEEQQLRERGIEILDEPCPFVRKLRRTFESRDDAYQYVLLCEPNHIVVKNFAAIFPPDLILVQMANYVQRIRVLQNGKPLRLVPYVTILPSDVEEVGNFIAREFPDRSSETVRTACLWVHGRLSPITEIDAMSPEQLNGIRHAVVITNVGSANTSLDSLVRTLGHKGLRVVTVSSLREYRQYERQHCDDTVLLVRSPIPNDVERLILRYVRHGMAGALLGQVAVGLRRRLRRTALTIGRSLKGWRPAVTNRGG